MEKYITALCDHCKQNLPDHGGAESDLNLLYRTYTEYDPINSERIGFIFTTVSDPCLSTSSQHSRKASD